MTGTIINIIAVLVGGGVGLFFGNRLPERVKQTVLSVLGLFTFVIGIQMFLDSQNPITVLLALIFGGLIGEWWQIERGLERFSAFMEERFAGGEGSTESRFVIGMTTASLLFIIGPMAILGSIQDGLGGDFTLLLIKSILDFFAAMAFASTLGVGVLFSIVPLLVYQGGITLLASTADALLSEVMVAEMTAVGGVILVALAISSLLKIKKVRVGNLLPALLVAPLIQPLMAALLGSLGWGG
jgi:uncharacterized membrane protein YqgA involved in biofilm formation